MTFIFIPIIAAIISLFVRKKVWLLETVAVAAILLLLVYSINISLLVIQFGSLSLGPYFYVDALGAIMLLIVTVIGLAAGVYSVGYLREEVKKNIVGFRRVKQYFILLHFFILAMMFAVSTTNPILMWVGIEATTLSTAFLISFYNKPKGTEAAWKYLMINSIGLLFAFFGTLLYLTSVQAPTSGLINWQTLILNARNLNPIIAKMAFVFIIVGYGTKVGLSPMHTWLPDAHSNAPAPISSLLSGVLLNVAFMAILRFKIVTDLAIGSSYSEKLFIGFGLLSLVISAFIIFVQKNYKRLLAYSSIEHMGIVSLGIGFGGIGVFASILHMIYHSLTKSLMFFSAGNIFLKYSSTKINNIKGVLKTLPITGIIFFVGFLAIVGIPPFGLFITEYYIGLAGISVYPVLTIIFIVFLVLVFIGMLKQITGMLFNKPQDEIETGESNVWTVAPLVALTILLFILSIYMPTGLKTLISTAALALK